MRNKFEILAGLPATGPMHESFSATGTGTHSEGVVVRFFPEGSDSWVGNFQPGAGGNTSVIMHPNGEHIIVFARGQAYILQVSTKKLVAQFGGYIHEVLEVTQECALVLGDGTSLERFEKNGDITWQTKRISWDGMRDVRIQDDLILGEAYTPMGDQWIAFSVNLYTGELQGGSYDGPDA